MKSLIKWLLGGKILLFIILHVPTETAAQGISDSLRSDEKIRFGLLDNGLSYYIKDLKNPHHEISMNFLVKAGSNDELPHEINFAHHIEHLAFRESKNFPIGLHGNEKLLNELDMSIQNLGARTNRRSTNYFYNVPGKDNLKALSTGLLWFKDIASGLDLSKDNIDRERGILLQEHRSDEASYEKNVAENEMFYNLFPCINIYYKNFTAHNKSFPHQDLQQFYRKWYTPERMAVVVVGNIKNVDALEREIMNEFTDLAHKNSMSKTERCDPFTERNEKSFTLVRRSSKRDRLGEDKSVETFLFFEDSLATKETDGWNKILRRIRIELVTSILNERFKKSSKGYDKHFQNYSSYTRADERPPNMITILMNTEVGHEKRSLSNTLKLLNQIITYGVTQEELEIAKSKKIREFEPSHEKNSHYWLREINNHFVHGESLPIHKSKTLQQWLENLTTDDLNQIIRQVMSSMPEDIGLIYPETETPEWQSEKEIREFIKKEFSQTVDPYKISREIQSLLSSKELASLRVENHVKPQKGKLDSHKYVLNNGLTLILKPMESEPSKLINIHGFTPYGASCFPEEEYISTMFAPWVIRFAGIGEFTKFDLEDFYQKTNSLRTGASPYIKNNEAGITADVTVEELEKLLQVIYLYFKEPRHDPLAFERWKADRLKNLEHSINPSNDLLDAINEVTKDNSNIPHASKKIRLSQKVEMDEAYQNYTTIFGDPGNFTFIVTGNFKEEDILPLLQKYLGNIPATSKLACPEEIKEMVKRTGPGYHEFGTSEFYETENAFYGMDFVKPEKHHWKEELKIKVLGLILDNLVYQLRHQEELSLYQMGVTGFYNRDMQRYEILFKINCLPNELHVVREKTKGFIEDVKKGKISREVFSNQRDFIKSVYNPVALSESSYIIKQLYRNYRFGETLVDATEIKNFFLDLELEDIVETANNYLQEKYMYEVILKSGKL